MGVCANKKVTLNVCSAAAKIMRAAKAKVENVGGIWGRVGKKFAAILEVSCLRCSQALSFVVWLSCLVSIIFRFGGHYH